MIPNILPWCSKRIGNLLNGLSEYDGADVRPELLVISVVIIEDVLVNIWPGWGAGRGRVTELISGVPPALDSHTTDQSRLTQRHVRHHLRRPLQVRWDKLASIDN